METLLRRIAHKLGYTLQRTKQPDPDALSFRHVLEVYLASHPAATFVEVGANDGKSNDPLYPIVTEYGLHGTAIEPQPDAFSRLEKTYEGTNVLCVNAAIGEGTLFVVKEKYKSDANWSRVSGIASFRKEVISRTIRNKIPKGANPDDYIEQIVVQSIELPQGADIYQIDCEGYDYEVVRRIDFSQKPAIINYERAHLSPESERACHDLLRSHGYRWFNHGIDTCAYLIS